MYSQRSILHTDDKSISHHDIFPWPHPFPHVLFPQATHLIVFVHRALTPLLTDLKSSAVPCGIGNQVGTTDLILLTLPFHFFSNDDKVQIYMPTQ